MGKWKDRCETHDKVIDMLREELDGYKELYDNERTGHAETWQKVVRAKADAVQCAREAAKLEAERDNAYKTNERLRYELHALQERRCENCANWQFNPGRWCRLLVNVPDEDGEVYSPNEFGCSEWEARHGD